MPVIRKALHGAHPDHDQLVAELVRHLRDEEGLPAFPRIVELQDRVARSKHVYVLWARWAGVAEEERSAIILEAYQEALGDAEMLALVVAMGVTPEEATRRGLEL